VEQVALVISGLLQLTQLVEAGVTLANKISSGQHYTPAEVAEFLAQKDAAVTAWQAAAVADKE
jgi:hypothetical protein